MTKKGSSYTAAIPSNYTDSLYPVLYYFELSKDTAAWYHPTFNKTLSNQPYYALYKRT